MLTWLHDAGGRSIFLVALWCTAYNSTSATSAMNGVPAAVISTAMLIVAVVLLRAKKRHGQPDSDVPASGRHRDRNLLGR